MSDAEDGGALVARQLAELGVRHLFAINGGHTWPIFAALERNGIELIHMRHEQACAFAADAYARVTREPGVLCVTAGCGVTNAITGLAVAGLVGSPVVCIAGTHPPAEDGLGSFQEFYGAEVCASFSRHTKRVLDPRTIAADLRQCFRRACTAPEGPALLEIPTGMLAAEAPKQRAGAYPAKARGAADPAEVERAVDLLLAAERPLIAGGDGILWSGAAPAFRELVECSGVPAYTRRAGQGALPEDHPLAVRGAWKKAFTGGCDVVLSVGFRFWSGERYGRGPTWNPEARFIQLDADPDRLGRHVPAEVALLGDPAVVLGQLCEALRARGTDPAARRRSAWCRSVQETAARWDEGLLRREAGLHDTGSLHPDRLSRELFEVLDPDDRVVLDSFALSGWLSQWTRARYPGQVLDAGPLAPVGHGIGMAIGARLGDPSRQVVVASGDGGFGVGAMELETALRYGIPLVVLVWNNSSWGPDFEGLPMLKGRIAPRAFGMIEGIRYDRMFAELGCHAEHVARPEDFVPALERSLASGKPAVIDIVGDRAIGHPGRGGDLLAVTERK